MNTFHIIFQRSIVTFMVLCFVFVSTYVPQSWNQIKMAEAGAAGGGASEVTQIANNVQLAGVNVATTASSAFNSITSFATSNMWIKENILDGIGWMLAKQIVSQMTASIVKWINSGFKGSPAFVQDLQGFLLNIGDQVLGQYLEDLGGPFSFICSPFQLDVRIALAFTYAQAREGQTTSSCTLTGALANIENFIDGSFDEGGWDAWFSITSNPTTYTSYGNILTAQTEAGIRIVNAQGKETKLLDFGSGFLSSKICEAVQGKGTTVQNCFISTPGKVIQDALTFQLSTGPRALIEADEINEIIGALMGQLAKQAITGAAGLLGLSGGTGYTAPGYQNGSFVDELAGSGATVTFDPVKFRNLLIEARDIETKYRTSAEFYSPLLEAFSNNILNDQDRRDDAEVAFDAIAPLLIIINANIAKLNTLITAYDALPSPAADTPATTVQRSKIMQDYLALTGLHSQSQITAAESNWQSLLR